MREAIITITGRVSTNVIQQLVNAVTNVEDPEEDLVIDVNPAWKGVQFPDDGSVIFYGIDVEQDVKATARAIAHRYPSVRLRVSDDVGNDIDYLSDAPQPLLAVAKQEPDVHTVALDLPAPLYHTVRRDATKHGHTIPEHLISWAEERVTSAA